MSINLKSLINYSVNSPIDTKFGLHCQRLGTLPTLSEWQKIKTHVQSYSPIKLLTATIQLELDILFAHPDTILSVRVPTLGFTDPAFDYDVRPWFLTPVVLNNYIAQSGGPEHQQVAALWATDIADNDFELFFTQEGLFNYDKISEQASSEVVFSTFKSIHYLFTLDTLMGRGLEKLPKKDQNLSGAALTFFPPPMMQKFYCIELSIIDTQKKLIHKRTVQIQSERQGHLFISHFETQHARAIHPKDNDYLSIKAGMYVEQELPFSRYGYKIKIAVLPKINSNSNSNSNPNPNFTSTAKLGKLSAYVQPIPYHFRPGIAYFSGKKAKNVKPQQTQLYEYVQFYGLSQPAMKQLIQIIISKDRFFKNHLIASAKENKTSKESKESKETQENELSTENNKLKYQYNNYYLHPDLLEDLYELITDACAHKTIPLYALSENFELSSFIFAKLMNLNTSEWDAHDQWVFERMIYEQLSSVCQDYDPMEVGFEWVDKIDKILNEHPTDIDIQNNIEIISGKLSAQQVIEIELYLEEFDKSAFIKYEENMPSLVLSKTLESAEFNQHGGKQVVIKNSLFL